MFRSAAEKSLNDPQHIVVIGINEQRRVNFWNLAGVLLLEFCRDYESLFRDQAEFAAVRFCPVRCWSSVQAKRRFGASGKRSRPERRISSTRGHSPSLARILAARKKFSAVGSTTAKRRSAVSAAS